MMSRGSPPPHLPAAALPAPSTVVTFSRRSTALLALFPAVLLAADSVPPAARAATPAAGSKAAAVDAKAAAPTEPKVVVLPKVEVTASRLRELDRQIRRLDKLISREKAKIKSTEVDRALNNEQLAKAAAIFGGNSAAHLSLVAAQRVGLLETERNLLADLKEPRTLEEVALIEKELTRLREMRRDLDKVGR